MEFVIRMKTVARLLIFAASLIVWLILLSVWQSQAQFEVFGFQEEVALFGAFALGLLQTWGIAYALRT